MAGSLNKVMIIGRIGKDPEVKYTQSGACVANFSVATDESYKDKQGNKVEQTEWHRCTVWGKQAEFVNKYLGKGRLVYVEGSLQTRSWEDQQGNKRYVTEIKAMRIQAMDNKPKDGQQSYQQAPQQQAPAPQQQNAGAQFPQEAAGVDDCPF